MCILYYVCVYVCSTVVYVYMYTIHVCMYVYYVCSSVMRVAHSVRARPLLLLCLCSVCRRTCAAYVHGVPVLVYCMDVVSMVVVMGSPCRTRMGCSVVYVSIVSLGCTYCSRYLGKCLCVVPLATMFSKECVCTYA